MEARDLGSTVTLYLPLAGTGAEPCVVFQDRRRAGGFATPDEALVFARDLAENITRSRKVPVRIRVEDSRGDWHSVEDAAAGNVEA